MINPNSMNEALTSAIARNRTSFPATRSSSSRASSAASLGFLAEFPLDPPELDPPELDCCRNRPSSCLPEEIMPVEFMLVASKEPLPASVLGDVLEKMLTLPVIHAVGSGSTVALGVYSGAPPSLPISAKRCAIKTAGTAAAAPEAPAPAPAPAAPPAALLAALAATEDATDVATEVATDTPTETAAAVRADAASGPRSMAPRAFGPGLLTFRYSCTSNHSGTFEVRS